MNLYSKTSLKFYRQFTKTKLKFQGKMCKFRVSLSEKVNSMNCAQGIQGHGLECFGRWLKVVKNVGHHGWPTKKILGYEAAKTVNFNPFQ